LSGWIGPLAFFACAAALRLYRIEDYTTFQGDQGIDALAARQLLVEHQQLFEGPATSAGGVHLGPAYYYVLALPMLLDWLGPLADALLVALLGAATVAIVFTLARRWVGTWPAMFAAGLCMVAPAEIVSARSAWNPAPAPFFAVLAVLGLDVARRSGEGRWLVLVGLSLGVLLQLHYFAVALALVVVGVVAVLVTVRRQLVWWAVAAMVLGVATLTPWLVHEVMAGWPNVRAAMALGSTAATATSAAESAPRRLYEVFSLELVGGYLTAGRSELLAALVSLGLLAAGVYALARRAGSHGLTVRLPAASEPFARGVNAPAVLVSALIAATLVLAMVYRGPIFSHYLLAVSPVLFLAVALSARALLSVPSRVVRWLAVLLGVALVAVNAVSSPLLEPAQDQLAQTRSVANAIGDAAGDRPYALQLAAEGDSDGAYRFWLTRQGRAPVPPSDPAPEQLFLICRAPECDPASVRSRIDPPWTDAKLGWQQQIGPETVLRLVRSD
jgi:hypothetical protein